MSIETDSLENIFVRFPLETGISERPVVKSIDIDWPFHTVDFHKAFLFNRIHFCMTNSVGRLIIRLIPFFICFKALLFV